MSDTLNVKARTKLGSRHSQRLRAEGNLPAILYGHGEEPKSLSVKLDELRGVLRHGGKVVQLAGAADGQALVQDTQWDTFGTRVLHLDLMRVVAGEALEVEVEVDLKGEAAGLNEGGMIDQIERTVMIEAPPASIPERLHIDITELHLGGSMAASDISDLPEGAKLVTAADTMIVHCVPPAGEAEETSAEAAGEPEVIGGKSDEESAE